MALIPPCPRCRRPGHRNPCVPPETVERFRRLAGSGTVDERCHRIATVMADAWGLTRRTPMPACYCGDPVHGELGGTLVHAATGDVHCFPDEPNVTDCAAIPPEEPAA